MLRVALSTFGTAGDIIPFARLATALLARGHAVTVHSWPWYRGWFPDGVRFVEAAGGITEAELDATLDHALRATQPFGQLERFATAFYGLGGATRARAQYDSARACFANHDVAVINLLDELAQAAADDSGLRWLGYSSRPPSPPAATTDGFFADVDAAVGSLVAEVSGRGRRVRVWRSLSPHGTLAPCSPHIVDPSAPSVRVTGAWLDVPKPEPLAPAIEAFLAGGPALFATFGTMPDVTGRVPALIGAAAKSGWRMILQDLSSTPPAATPDLFVLRERVSFGALLPRVAAVVHHGSVGTLHEVLRAGVPSLVLPHMGDQFFWGGLLHARGLAPAPVPHQALDAHVLAARFAALRDPTNAWRAQALGPHVAREDGVTAAALVVERTR